MVPIAAHAKAVVHTIGSNIELQVLDNQSRSIPAGTLFTLLGNGEPLATGSTDAHGVVTFSLDREWTEGLAVRLAGLPPAEGFPPKLEIKKKK